MTYKNYLTHLEIIKRKLIEGKKAGLYSSEFQEKFNEITKQFIFLDYNFDFDIEKLSTNHEKREKFLNELMEYNKNFNEIASEIYSEDESKITELSKYDLNEDLLMLESDLAQEIETLNFWIRVKSSQRQIEILLDKFSKDIEEQKKELKEHDKNILNMMGIFLAIFSLIGINVSFFASTFSNSSGKPIEVCEFLKYLLGVNVILVLAIMTVFELIRRYTKK
ncbi:hypothetical protein [Sebaldella termitidis]|uniref:hypothetical protein n=1 Tax=Sebaldella termitidis TaxID=826 RepID=UPI003EBA45F5